MNNFLIIEDEMLTANRLESLLIQINSQYKILHKIQSVKKAISWLTANEEPDLIFMDIELSDGISFEIFKLARINCPVIFTTAYDQYAVEAFKVQGLDYLLKPIDAKQLQASLQRFHSQQLLKTNQEILNNVLASIQSQKNPHTYRSRFLVQFRDIQKSIEVNDIAYFVSEFKVSYAVTSQNEKYAINNTLEELELQLDPAIFFRANRQLITKATAIIKLTQFFNGRTKLTLQPNYNQEILVSREKTLALKEWLDK